MKKVEEQQETALLVIDVQVGLTEGEQSVTQVDRLLSTLRGVISEARAANAPVIYVQDIDVGGVGTAAFQIRPEIAPQEGDLIVHKRAADAFYDTPLQSELEARGIKHLVIAGCKSEFCVDTTCRLAPNLGFDVTLLGDAHGTSNNAVLSAEQVIAHHNRLLHGFGVDNHCVVVRPVAEVSFPAIWNGHPD